LQQRNTILPYHIILPTLEYLKPISDLSWQTSWTRFYPTILSSLR